MFSIVSKKQLNSTVVQMEILAPLVAKKALAGQFVILRVDENGERIPLTVAAYDRSKGTITVIFQIVGATTMALNQKEEGESICDFVGPLGNPTDCSAKKVCIVGGGVGCAIALPVAKQFAESGADVTSIIGFRSKDLVILEDEFRACSKKLVVMTDDGSYAQKGNVTLPLTKMLADEEGFDQIITIGPLIMMKYVVAAAKPFMVPVVVSMNPIMIDGTGMCGGCRLSLYTKEGRKTKFACVDGPDFNGYEIDFDEAISRNRAYVEMESRSREAACSLFKKA